MRLLPDKLCHSRKEAAKSGSFLVGQCGCEADCKRYAGERYELYPQIGNCRAFQVDGSYDLVEIAGRQRICDYARPLRHGTDRSEESPISWKMTIIANITKIACNIVDD